MLCAVHAFIEQLFLEHVLHARLRFGAPKVICKHCSYGYCQSHSGPSQLTGFLWRLRSHGKPGGASGGGSESGGSENVPGLASFQKSGGPSQLYLLGPWTRGLPDSRGRSFPEPGLGNSAFLWGRVCLQASSRASEQRPQQGCW